LKEWIVTGFASLISSSVSGAMAPSGNT
jgi:hypothetical protein